MTLKSSKIVSSKEAKRLISFIDNSFDDYFSSRILFNSNQLLQACHLANTAIEKYFKAILEYRGNTTKIKHDLTKFLPSIKNYDSSTYEKLNINFIKEISRLYPTRYLGDLEDGFNGVIVKKKYLAELDYTFSILSPKIMINKTGQPYFMKNKYDAAIEDRDEKILKNNYILNGLEKSAFIESLDVVLEFRILENGQIYEVRYPTIHSVNDGVFQYNGMIPNLDEHSFTLSHKIYENYIAK